MIIHKVDLLEQTSFRSSHYKSLGVGFNGNILIILFCSISIVICCLEQSENIALVKQQRAHDCIWSSESSTNFDFITTCKDTTKCSKSKQTIITVTYQKHQNGTIYNKSSPQPLFFIKPTISTAHESNLLVVKDALPFSYIWLRKLLYYTLMASGFEIILLFTRQLSNIAVVVGRRWWLFACQLRFQKIASIPLGDYWIKTLKNISKRNVNKHGNKNKLFTRAENNIRNIPKIFSANSATLLKTFTDHSLTGSSSCRITYNDFPRSNFKSNIRENIKSEIKHYQSLNSGRRRTLGDFLLLMLFFHVYYQRQQHEKKRMQYKKEKRRKELRSDRESNNFEREYCQKNQGVRIRNSCYQLNSKISSTRCSLYCGNTYQKFGAHFNGDNYKSLIKINSWWMCSICYYCYNIFRCHIGVCYKCASVENLKYCRINWPLHLSQWYYKDGTHQSNPHFLLKCCYNCQSLNNNNNIIVSKTIQYNNTAIKNATAYTKLPIAVMSFIWKWKTWFPLKSELTTNFFYALGSFEVTNNIFISCYKCNFKNNKVSKWLPYHSSLTHELLLIPRLRKLLPRIKEKTIKSISSYSYKNSMKSNDLNSNYLGLMFKLYSVIGSNALYLDMHEVNPLRLLLFNNGKYITCCVKKRRRGRRRHRKHRYLWKKFLIKVLIYCTHSNECYNIITPLQYLHNTNATTTTKIATTNRAARHCHNRFLLRSSIRLNNSSKPNLVWLLIGLFWFKISKINGNINHNGNHNYLEIPYIKNLTQHEKTNHSEINKGYNNFSIGNFRLSHYPLNLRAKSACHNYEKVHLQRTSNIHRSTHDLFNNYVHNTKHKLLWEEYERYQIKAKGVTSGSTSYVKGAVYVQSDEMRLESIKKQILSKLGLSGKPQIMRPLAKQFIWDTIYRADGVGSLSMYYSNRYKHNLNKRHLIDNKNNSGRKGLRLKTKVPLKIKNMYYSINKQMISKNYSYNRIHQNSKHRSMVSKYEKNKFQQRKHHTHTSTAKTTMYIENYTNPFTIITPRTNIESIGTIINKSFQFETYEVLNPNFTSSFFCNRDNIHYQRGQHILTSLLKPSASTPQHYYNSNKQKNSKLNKIQHKNSNVGSMFNNSRSSTLTYLVDFTRSNEDNIDIKLDYQYDEYFNNKNDSTTKQKSQKSQRHEINAHPNKIINNHRNIFKPYKTRSSSSNTTTTSLHSDDIENEELFTNTEEIIIFAEEGVIYKRHHLVEFSSQNTELAKDKLIVRDAKIHLRINKITLTTERNSRYQRHATATQQHNSKKLKIWIFQLLNLNLANHSNDQAFKFCGSYEVNTTQLGWQKFDLTSTVKEWYNRYSSETLRLLIDCTGCGKLYAVELFDDDYILSKMPSQNSMLSESKLHGKKNVTFTPDIRGDAYSYNTETSTTPIRLRDSEVKLMRPFLVLHTESKRLRRIRRRTINCNGALHGQCCKESFYVSFKALGWDDWIIAPRGYFANYCRGDCVGPYRTPDTFQTFHAHFIEEYRKMGLLNGMQPCCAPVKFSSMSLIYYGDEGIIKRDLPKMVVDECGCP